MAKDITEPFDWFAEDATDTNLTVPDWVRQPTSTSAWYGGAQTLPALTLDSALLAAPPWPERDDTPHTGKAMLVYAISVVLSLSLLFGMFFVFGGRFSAQPTRHTALLLSIASSGGQMTQGDGSVKMPKLPAKSTTKPTHHAIKYTTLPTTSALPGTDANSGDLWATVPSASVLSPKWPSAIDTAVPQAAAHLIASLPTTDSLWSASA